MCGRGVSSRAKGLGAHVIVTEVDPTAALEAVMEGYRVMPLRDAARIGDLFITVTGDTTVIGREHLELMQDGAILANSGHFDVEIDKGALRELATGGVRRIREFVDEYTLADGRRLNLLGEGRLVNLAAAEGHPAAVMDMSFANQALCVEWIVKHHGTLEKRVYPVPEEIDREVARLKLRAMGVEIDTLTEEQDRYLHSWDQGT
jgi:adenosylhomocysteinase